MANQTTNVSGWVGWIGFAATMLALVGILHMVAGFVALFQNDLYMVTANSVWMFDSSTWGWLHIIGGLIALTAAASLANGHMYGRIIAVLVAVASAVINMAFVPVYPFWSIMMFVIDIFILWAVIVHGSELKVDQPAA